MAQNRVRKHVEEYSQNYRREIDFVREVRAGSRIGDKGDEP